MTTGARDVRPRPLRCRAFGGHVPQDEPYAELLKALQEPMRRLGERLLEDSLGPIRANLKAYSQLVASQLTPPIGVVAKIGPAVEHNIPMPITPAKVVPLAGVAAAASSARAALTVESVARDELQPVTLADLAMVIALLTSAAAIMLSVLEGDPVRRNVESFLNMVAFLIALYGLGRRS